VHTRFRDQLTATEKSVPLGNRPLEWTRTRLRLVDSRSENEKRAAVVCYMQQARLMQLKNSHVWSDEVRMGLVALEWHDMIRYLALPSLDGMSTKIGNSVDGVDWTLAWRKAGLNGCYTQAQSSPSINWKRFEILGSAPSRASLTRDEDSERATKSPVARMIIVGWGSPSLHAYRWARTLLPDHRWNRYWLFR